MSRYVVNGKVYYLCLVRKYKAGTHCKEFTDEYVLRNTPCDPSRSPSADPPCKKAVKLKKKRRTHKRYKKKPRYHLPTGTPRYRVDIKYEVPNIVGRERWVDRHDGTVYRDETTIAVVPRPDRFEITGKRIWDRTNPPPPRSWRDLYRVSATGIHELDYVDRGGPLRIIQTRSDWNKVEGLVNLYSPLGGIDRRYDGGFLPSSFGSFGSNDLDFAGNWVLEPENTLGDPEPYGSIGWNMFKPKLIKFDAPLAIYELKDLPGQWLTTAGGMRDVFHGLPKAVRQPRRVLKSALAEMPKAASEHFLNHVFGWVPFVNDLTTGIDSVMRLNEYLAKQIAQNGQWVHRGGTISKSDEVIAEYDTKSDEHFPRIYPVPDDRLLRTEIYNGTWHYGYSHFTLRKIERIWFSGLFRYFLPSLMKDHESLPHMMNLLRIFGARISPDLIWKATPWTWLFDWFTQTSSLINYWTEKANNDLAARYAYVMREVTYVKTHTAVLHLNDGSDLTMTWQQEITSKRRAKASPFGFGLDGDNLSSRQIAILAALGLSRVT